MDYEGSTIVELHDGSRLALSKVDDKNHDVQDQQAAMKVLYEAKKNDQFVTGLFYYNKDQKSLVERQQMASQSLSEMSEKELKPSAESLSAIMERFS